VKPYFYILLTTLIILISPITSYAAVNSDYKEGFTYQNPTVITYQYENQTISKDRTAYQSAFRAWTKALHQKIKFIKVADAPDVVISSANYGDWYTGKAGNTYYMNAVTQLTVSGSVLIHSKIYMYDKTLIKTGNDNKTMRLLVAEHEIGHILGLGELDQHPNDVMSRIWDYSSQKLKISQLDVRTVLQGDNLG
jgi:predicted Zn-dependent protease